MLLRLVSRKTLMHLGRNIFQPHEGEKMVGAREESAMHVDLCIRVENQITKHHHEGKYRYLFLNSHRTKTSHFGDFEYSQI